MHRCPQTQAQKVADLTCVGLPGFMNINRFECKGRDERTNGCGACKFTCPLVSSLSTSSTSLVQKLSALRMVERLVALSRSRLGIDCDERENGAVKLIMPIPVLNGSVVDKVVPES